MINVEKRLIRNKPRNMKNNFLKNTVALFKKNIIYNFLNCYCLRAVIKVKNKKFFTQNKNKWYLCESILPSKNASNRACQALFLVIWSWDLKDAGDSIE